MIFVTVVLFTFLQVSFATDDITGIDNEIQNDIISSNEYSSSDISKAIKIDNSNDNIKSDENTNNFNEENLQSSAKKDIVKSNDKNLKESNSTSSTSGKKTTYIILDIIRDVELGNTTTISGRYYYDVLKPLTYTPMTLNINGEKYTVKTDATGYFTYNYTTDTPGKNTVTVSYHGNDKFKAASATQTFNVKTNEPQYTYIILDIIRDVELGETTAISGHYYYGLLKPLTYTPMTLNIDGEKYTVKTDKNGYFTYNYTTDTPGKNTVTVSYHGNKNFKAATATQTFNVKSTGPQYTYIILDDIKEVACGEKTAISGHYYYGLLKPLTYTPMTLNINSEKYTVKTDKNGYFTYNYTTNKAGSNIVTVSYHGNKNFKAASATQTFNVKSTGPQYTYIKLNNIKEVTCGEYTIISGYYYYGNNIPLTYTPMSININGEKFTAKTDNNGYFTYNYKTSKEGSNNVTVSYHGNSNFMAASATKTFNVKSTGPQYTYIKLNNIKEVECGNYTTISGYYYYGNDIPLTYTPMTLNINGEKYTVKTDATGYFTYNYKTDTPGINMVTVSYHGNSKFKAASATKTFNVKSSEPQFTYIILNRIPEVTCGDYTTISGHYYYSLLKPLTYTPMSLKINGVTYTAKTDNNGYFTYNYKTNKAGSNNVTVSYHGNSNFKAASATKTFKVLAL